jgi:adenine-specific DNA-methyltransferase
VIDTVALRQPEESPSRLIRQIDHGVVYTQDWVVNAVLDIAGYTADADLSERVAVEPSCGTGEFLVVMTQRLLEAAYRAGRRFDELSNALVAFELDDAAASEARSRVETVLTDAGCPKGTANRLASGWVNTGDFLLSRPNLEADFVVGNPPYVRIEAIESGVLDEYRSRYSTMKGRADLYVAFFQRSLAMLTNEGVCVFICADRWMLNQYGSALRRFITDEYAVDAVVEMHKADAFHDEVLAYPAITRIRKGKQGVATVATVQRPLSNDEAAGLAALARGEKSGAVNGVQSACISEWFQEGDPWPCTSPERLVLLRDLETRFPRIEDSAPGTRVGIGIATGCDSVFVTTDPMAVEPERLVPLAWHKDTLTGTFEWSGRYLINPWEHDGSLIDLDHFPMTRAHFESHGEKLRARQVANKNQDRWYRTIDNLRRELLDKEKLLIPDIKGHLHPVIELGATYPHHNLYYVVSETWPLRALGGLLLSEVAQFFIDCYAVRMAGGYYRFQAQYLRRIRVPHLDHVAADDLSELALAFSERSADRANAVARRIYGIGPLAA